MIIIVIILITIFNNNKKRTPQTFTEFKQANLQTTGYGPTSVPLTALPRFESSQKTVIKMKGTVRH